MAKKLSALSCNPLDELPFPVWCNYPDCGAGPFQDGIQVDEHITEEHLAAAVWTFAEEQMRLGSPEQDQRAGRMARAQATTKHQEL